MYNIQLDNDGYWTGGALTGKYSTYGNGIFVSELPTEIDAIKKRAHKFIDGILVFDVDKFAELEAERELDAKQLTAEERIQALEEELAAFKVVLGVE